MKIKKITYDNLEKKGFEIIFKPHSNYYNLASNEISHCSKYSDSLLSKGILMIQVSLDEKNITISCVYLKKHYQSIVFEKI